jgi:hypothetical protein
VNQFQIDQEVIEKKSIALNLTLIKEFGKNTERDLQAKIQSGTVAEMG